MAWLRCRYTFTLPRRGQPPKGTGLQETAISRKPSFNLQPVAQENNRMSANFSTAPNTQSTPSPTAVRFQLGRIFITPGAIDALEDSGESAQDFINRHARLERGELGEEDYKENLFSVDKRLRIFSAFKTAQGVKIWVITESCRSATTLLLPSEY
jgi:hypothetical protein